MSGVKCHFQSKQKHTKSGKKASITIVKQWLSSTKSWAMQTICQTEEKCVPPKSAEDISYLRQSYMSDITYWFGWEAYLSIFVDDESLETITEQIMDILELVDIRYKWSAHDLGRNICVTSSDFLEAAFESQVSAYDKY